jgi:soluble lytic murein transglycosylase-like protein
MVSGAAFWASRVHLRLGHPEAASRWLHIAAEEPRTLYGLLDNRALGAIPEFYWEPQALTNNDLDVVLAVPAVVRAIALYEVGQTARASKEVLRIQYRATPEIARALLALATALQLPALETSLGGRLGAIDGRRHDFAVYPVPGWVPDNGFTVDPALIYALIRQESRFKETAKSRRGARGVMQVMPNTARFAARSAGLGRISRDALMIPETNIAIGQAYVGHLLEHDLAGQNLLFTLASYNAGPGNLSKWLPNTNFGEDPLLFMESTRSRETRHFMRVVLTNYWIYRLRLGEQTPSLDQMAGGTWPTYSGPRQ